MKPYENDEKLADDLRALKPAPRPEFTAELDERAAAGFPRRSRLSWPSLSRPGWTPRRMLLPAGGFAVIAIAIATAFAATDGTEPEPERNDIGFLSLTDEASESAPSGGSTAAGAAEGATEELPSPTTTFEAAGPAAGGGVNRLSRRGRAVERFAQIVLAAEPGDVAEDSREVFEAVHAHNGIVLRSSTREGEAGVARAQFELLIPSPRLNDALAALSEIDEVRSRLETTNDITAPTVTTGELLQESKARIDSLLGQLEAAETESERETVEAELRQERRHRARLRAQLQQLQKRADFTRVSLRIETDAAEDSSGGGTWGVDDAVRDAGQVLSTAAAVSLVALAVIAPIALIGLLAWLAHRAWVRRERRRVLG